MSQEIIAIVAINYFRVIGVNGKIPWENKDDMKHFRKLTMGHPCVFGRKTYESISCRPLKGRENIVLTRDPNWSEKNVSVFSSIEDVLEHVKNEEKVFVCGGREIYLQFLPFITKMEVSVINNFVETGTIFPDEYFSFLWNLSSTEGENVTFYTLTNKELPDDIYKTI